MGLNADLIRSSLGVVVEREEHITPRFYELLFSRYPQVKPLFSRNAPEKQAKMLQDSIVAVVDHIEDGEWLTETLGNMGAQHVDYEVTDDMYPWVGECLLATLAEIAGDDWTPEVAKAWEDAVGAIAGLMIAGAQKRRAADA
jgi:hemoglobin-like flavoprotein